VEAVLSVVEAAFQLEVGCGAGGGCGESVAERSASVPFGEERPMAEETEQIPHLVMGR
jgi:hypothetical protein